MEVEQRRTADTIATEHFEITDAEARRDWEGLLGFKIKGPTVRLTRDTYLRYAGQIQAIQMAAAFRVKR
jgi:hypothetical protein